ncbi:thioredoxin domain-containing protein [Elioraea tepidiphila]|uniref:thioredoxin domain-containing protein n=1 Tax=Elioraea tepidiphila TaxID=457934 RepID=UPI000382EA05|nr:thioredoxin domain-containing protein [Elioraea tepidiphila]
MPDTPTATLPPRNLLADETSPYLLQHADNPVHWRPWSDAALAEARATGKPILLSIGYAACHWCHVMAHESFENPAVAALMNRHFVNIKVDREERPDIDAIYMQALHLMGEHGGWPLTMFLTPDAKPFWGGTYFPPEPRFGRPSFPQVLDAIARVARDEPEKVAKNVAALTEALAAMARARPGAAIGPEQMETAAATLLRTIDRRDGGLQGAPKFPQSALFRFLWNEHRRTGNASARAAVALTLDRMSRGGIYDHLGGGYARYSTDAQWLVPHFEKMLYDNAQILELLSLLADDPDPALATLWRARAEETVAWLAREMIAAPAADGTAGFASTLDADSEGEEGRFYVWTDAQVRSVLKIAGFDPGAIDRFCRAYDVTPQGNWEHKVILNRSASPTADPAEEAGFARARAALFANRAARIPPGRDDKVLADWNGLMIAALARAGHVFDQPGWIALAARAFAFVARHMDAGEAGGGRRLWHSWRNGTVRVPGLLTDYAAMIRAGVILAGATADPAPLRAAESWTRAAFALFADTDGAFFTSPADAADVIVRAKDAADNAVPSGNGMMADALARLWLVTGEDRYRAAAAGLVAAYAGGAAEQPWAHPWLLVAADMLERGASVVVAGAPDGPDTRALVAAAHAVPELGLTVQLVGDDLPPGHPAAGKRPVDGRAAAYVCRAGTCGLPLTEPRALRAALEPAAPAAAPP